MIWAISDIHGMYDNLIKVLNQIPENDKIIFLGDYVDRGPGSRQVLDLLFKLKNRAVFLKGNHEDMMLDYFENTGKYKEGAWFRNGAQATLDSFNNDIEEKYLDFIRNLKLYHIEKIGTQKYLFVHGGIRPGISLSDQAERDLLWIRDDFYMSDQPYEDYIVIHGHTPTKYITGEYEVYFRKLDDKILSIDIDTGCVYGGKLSALGISNDNKYDIISI
ncbi:metallophosphoesterase [Marinitoga sp. 1135]|uniref:Putative phosphohydrolase n=1 Tax=Marinitoga piezophila (strain DSM 14283 / JCM 11233 / KA3) TaxID=443254 RepID=H2J819_MARPK|nr:MULTISPECIES: metallophosphoesterase family protein [Marinitoga]AEX85510.1 putative phosphohydrolase [Marinitoga piezophila KA3]APT75978.1 metallophosphoesterase [Marinitoga sp. 1137]NUU95719.1 metallophosphoesterase [Marinitoga sp. 1135]NUU97651.1 metallophosphoesterase [Marinitoga sp. 1138]